MCIRDRHTSLLTVDTPYCAVYPKKKLFYNNYFTNRMHSSSDSIKKPMPHDKNVNSKVLKIVSSASVQKYNHRCSNYYKQLQFY